MEKQSVEDSLKHAFQDAEMRPSSAVWTHIELGIEKEEGNELKKRVVFYRWMAAASVLVAVSLLGAGYFTMYKDLNNHTPLAVNTESTSSIKNAITGTENNNEALSTTTTTPPALAHDQVHVDKEVNTSKGSETGNALNPSDNARSNIKSMRNEDTKSLTGNTLYSEANSSGFLPVEKEDQKYKNRARSPLPPIVVQQPYKIHFPKTEPDQIDLLLAAVEMEEKESRKKKVQKETLWTSVGMAAGTYNPVIASSSGARTAFSMDGTGSLNNNAQVVNLSSQVEASGYSFSSGVSVGGKVADRWIIQGGVNYLTQNSTYNSNAVLVDGANKYKLASLNAFSSEKTYSGAFYQASSPYTVNSSLKYFNIPLQAGYLIINKDFGWQMQGGISTDFFLQNTLSAEDAGFDKVSQGGGDESPYRTVNFSGLIGTEVSYRFGQHYRVAINPGFRYPLQSVYKSDTGVSAAPIMFDVGLKFHYIFR